MPDDAPALELDAIARMLPELEGEELAELAENVLAEDFDAALADDEQRSAVAARIEELAEVDEPAADVVDEEPSLQARIKAMETEDRRHRKAFAKAIGVEEELLNECPTCEATGFTPEPVAGEDDYEPAPNAIECPSCKGRGRVRYPTHVDGHKLQTCTNCAGNGWKPESPDMPSPPPVASASPPPLVGNGPQAPPGYVLVPVSPDYSPPPHPVSTPPVVPST